MKKISVDVTVIGAGTAGLNARRAAEKAGAKTLLIGRPPHGTTCARVGCMPSKLLIAAAEAAHNVQRSETFGFKTSLRVNGAKVLERVQKKT
jgi:dihydrolipoamide dehydrogenase